MIYIKGTVKWQGGGGGVGVVSIDRPLNPLHCCRFEKNFKDPGLLKVVTNEKGGAVGDVLTIIC